MQYAFRHPRDVEMGESNSTLCKRVKEDVRNPTIVVGPRFEKSKSRRGCFQGQPA